MAMDGKRVKVWYCETCGEFSKVETPDYVVGDREPCVLCPNDPVGTAVVWEVQFVARETAPIDESPPTLPTGQAPSKDGS